MSRNKPPSRPTTPLRPSSRTSLRDSQGYSAGGASSSFPLESLEPAFAELSDSMADMEANFMHLQLMHESLSRFNESFASFLYGLNMNAFCVDFPEAPLSESFQRAAQNEEVLGHATESERYRQDGDGETTFMTADTSYVSTLPTSSRASSKFNAPTSTSRSSSGLNRRGVGGIAAGTRGGAARDDGRGTRGSSLARARARGTR
ncbi:DASH complex subunit dam1 [Sticta canariensis]|nr:DASH complex subunit dam1 [Sticta canariensis]